jgi:hypothetical protein
MCRHSAQFYSSLVSIMMKNLKFENVLYWK